MGGVRLAFIGDVMLGRLLNSLYGQQPADSFWGGARRVLVQADAVFANLECAITTHRRKWTRTPKVFHFGADPAAIEVLKAGNVKYVSLANNHILDFGEEGLLDTLNYLDEAGIVHAGAGKNPEEAMRPVLFTVAQDAQRELHVGVISLTDNEPSFAVGMDRPGTWYTEINAETDTLELIGERIAHLKAQGARLIVLSVHWGPNMVQKPPQQFREFAEAVTDMGVDVLHGHSAHIFQGVCVHNGSLILYDTGEFLDDYAADSILHNDWSFVFMVEADNDGLIGLEMLPVRLNFARTDLAEGVEFEEICLRMEKLSADLGTFLLKTGRGLELKIRQGRSTFQSGRRQL